MSDKLREAAENTKMVENYWMNAKNLTHARHPVHTVFVPTLGILYIWDCIVQCFEKCSQLCKHNFSYWIILVFSNLERFLHSMAVKTVKISDIPFRALQSSTIEKIRTNHITIKPEHCFVFVALTTKQKFARTYKDWSQDNEAVEQLFFVETTR